ncbi:MAG: DUF507 family protein [Deltaproteobacteria bacterium]|nr:DUF507 family protein [Deltaproteobacteria bacterium]
MSEELLRALTADGDIEIESEEEVRLDFEAVFKEYVRRDRRVLDEAKGRMEREGLSYGVLGKIKSQVARDMGFPGRDEQLPYLVEQVMTMLFHSNNVVEVYGEDHVLRKKITTIIKRHTNLEDDLDKEVRSKIKNLSEGTASFEIEYEKVMEQIKRRKGLS